MDDKAKEAIVSEFSKQISAKCDRRLVKCAVDNKVSFAFLKLHIKVFIFYAVSVCEFTEKIHVFSIHLKFGPAVQVKLYFLLLLFYF
jgi:hypothetical protein